MKKIKNLRIIRAYKNTLDGIKGIWRKEPSFRQEVYISIMLLPIIIIMHIPPTLKILLILLLLLLLVVEALNSALEVIVDRISLEIHAQSKLAKDIGSAAVGMTIAMNAIAWVYAFYIHFWLH